MMMPHTHQEGMKRFINLNDWGLWEEENSPLKQAWKGKERRLAEVFIVLRVGPGLEFLHKDLA